MNIHTQHILQHALVSMILQSSIHKWENKFIYYVFRAHTSSRARYLVTKTQPQFKQRKSLYLAFVFNSTINRE